MKSHTSKWLIAALLLALCISTVMSAHSHSHSHSHDHDHDHDHDHSHSHDRSTKQTTTTNTNAKRDVTAKFENLKQRTLQEVNVQSPPTQGYWDTVVTHVSGSTWMSAIISTIIIGIAPIFILFFIPLTKEDGKENKISVNQPLLKTLLSFAIGGLLGDVFLHLLPHAMVPHEHEEEGAHSHSHSHDEHGEEEGHAHDISVGLLVLAGIIVFFLLEKYMRLKGGHEGHSHGHSHSHGKKEDAPSSPEARKKKETKEKKQVTPAAQPVKITGYLNIIADTAHNFTDGMAIAASFLISTKVGISTTIAVFFHEIPHEVGDYAILIQSGFSKKQAMLVQVWTAIGAVAGCAIALAAGGYVDSVNWILPFTAGGFIYIAMVNVLPELLEESSASQTIKELFGICLGISMMSLIALYE